ncbi:MAG: DUF4263 domain-containing protein [Firmicutes bacterium]|nr:DUF4263 domain-containing protein [Bacillota bacterium]
MSEIKQSKKGILHTQSKRLSTKKGVYADAWIYGVPHSDSIEVSLKLGRYKYPKELETAEPKSELTLTNNELDALIEYIAEYYKPLSLDTRKFFSYDEDDKDLGKLLLKFKNVAENNEEIAKALLENNFFTDDIQTAITAIKKEKALIKFETELNNDNNEVFWQKWFNANKWILGSEYLKILEERKIDTNNIADFLVQAFDGFVDIVEIKKTDLPFWANSKDHKNLIPSTDLIKAITQCQNYLYEIEREVNDIKTFERLKTRIIKPRCLLVFGKSNGWDDEKREAYRILNSSYVNLTILTYDHLLERAKNVMSKIGNDNKTNRNIQTIDYDDLPF